ncbi:UNVERIFIED_CONTAM: hypothetical protein K2H54_062209, partial [Gekko kuhli]
TQHKQACLTQQRNPPGAIQFRGTRLLTTGRSGVCKFNPITELKKKASRINKKRKIRRVDIGKKDQKAQKEGETNETEKITETKTSSTFVDRVARGKRERSPPLPQIMQSSFPHLGKSQGSAHPQCNG